MSKINKLTERLLNDIGTFNRSSGLKRKLIELRFKIHFCQFKRELKKLGE